MGLIFLETGTSWQIRVYNNIPDKIKDIGVLIDKNKINPWSNSKVTAMGIMYHIKNL